MIWVGWGLFVGAFFLPAFREPGGTVLAGYSCAWIAVASWAPERLLALIREPEIAGTWVHFSMGWFNVSNLLCALAPALAVFPGVRRYRGLVALGCALGAVQAVALVSGALGGEPLWSGTLAGFWVWFAGHGVVGLSVHGMGRATTGPRGGE